jgi:hypothetical protein
MKAAIKIPEVANTKRRLLARTLWSQILRRTMKSAWLSGPGTKRRCHVQGSRLVRKSTALTLIKPIRYLISY